MVDAALGPPERKPEENQEQHKGHIRETTVIALVARGEKGKLGLAEPLPRNSGIGVVDAALAQKEKPEENQGQRKGHIQEITAASPWWLEPEAEKTEHRPPAEPLPRNSGIGVVDVAPWPTRRKKFRRKNPEQHKGIFGGFFSSGGP